MKTKDEIQRAHDLLVPLLTGKVPWPIQPMSPDLIKSLHAACDALCWVLEHDHNKAFALNLTGLEMLLKNAGVNLIDHGN